MNYFETLNNIDVSEHVEDKNGFSYLSWAWAWQEAKKRFPKSFYTIYENADGWNYHTDGRTAWVKTGVTIVDDDSSLEHIEYLPVMDYRNKSIPLDNITSFDVNKAIQRSLTKALARHGLGLYIYAGEDLPESSKTLGTDKSNAIYQEFIAQGFDGKKIIAAMRETAKKFNANNPQAVLNKDSKEYCNETLKLLTEKPVTTSQSELDGIADASKNGG